MGQAQRTSAVTSSIGVNVHLPGGQGNAYGELSLATIQSDCTYLGATVLRDNIPDPSKLSAGTIARYVTLAKAGFKFDFCIGSSNSDLDTAIKNLSFFATSNPGSIRYIEGPNEINYNSFTYKGVAGQSGAILFQTDLYNYVKGSPLFRGVEVIDFTGGGALLGPSELPEPISGIADLAATHVYPALGDPPAWYVANTFQFQYGKPINAPYIITEAGYNSDPVSENGVSLDVQAKQTLMLLMDTARSGSKSTMLYELFDMYADPGNKSFDDHWGLFDASGAPTLTSTAIHNLLSTLSDTSSAADTFVPGNASYTISNMPAAGRSWLMEKANGVFDLALWSEVPIWDRTTRSELNNSGSSIAVDLGRQFDYIDVYDPLISSIAVAHFTNASQISLNLTDHTLIVQFGFNLPIPGATTPQPPGAVTTMLQPTAKIITGNRDGGVTLAGNSAANSTVTVSNTVGAVTTMLGTATVSSTGSWTLTSHVLLNMAAINAFTVTAQDTSGKSGSMPGQFLLASTGVDTLAGKSGVADVFAIMSFRGSDIINGFESSAAGAIHDTLDFSGRGVSSFSQLKPMISGEISAVISIGSGKTITLSNVGASTLTAADFRFS